MSVRDDERDEVTALQRYQGVPNSHVPHQEKGRWRQFLEAAMPWLKHKWDLADAAADARLAQEIAKAEQMLAQVELTRVQTAEAALKTIAMARELEQQKLQSSDMASLSIAELEAEMAEIAEKIKMLGWKYGTRFEFQVVSDAPADASADAVALRRTELEQALAIVWCEVLEVHAVDGDDNFFDLGGNSLMLSRLHIRLAEMGYDVTMTALFQYPTISSQAQMLERIAIGDARS